MSWTAFTFLPVLIAITASKKFGVNTYAAVVIACALVSPDYINMVNAGKDVFFMGIRVQLLSYTSSVIPIILSIWIASYFQRFFEKHLPVVVRNLFTPMFTIAIMVPLTLLAFGPIGNTIGGAIGTAYNTLYNLSPIIAGLVVGGFWEVLVIFGVHWGITPVTVGNYATLGYDTFTGLQASAVFSQAGAAFGVFFKTKDKDMKGVSLSAAITGLFGITEPAIYGVNLRLKKPMICGCVAGAIGGAIGGMFHVVSWGYNMPRVATLPAYFKIGHMNQFVGLLISVLVSFLLGAILTYVVGFDEEVSEEISDERLEKTETKEIPGAGKTVMLAPVEGSVMNVTKVNDAVFSSEAMGKGVGIVPTDGKIYAPCDGIAEAVFPTGHAIGLKTEAGLEILIHIGIDTVSLEGKGFTPYVKQGDKVKAGDLLVDVDFDFVKKQGLDTTVIFVLTDMDEIDGLEIMENQQVKALDKIIQVTYKEM